MLECEDKSLYTGITADIKARMRTHYYKLPAAAKYTKSHKVKELKLLFKTKEKSNALKLEAYIKTFPSVKKKELIKNPALIFGKFEESVFEITENIKLENFLLCEENEYEKISKLFSDEKALSFLNTNTKAKIYSDNPEKPKMACLITEEETFFGGKPNEEFLKLKTV